MTITLAKVAAVLGRDPEDLEAEWLAAALRKVTARLAWCEKCREFSGLRTRADVIPVCLHCARKTKGFEPVSWRTGVSDSHE